MRLINFGMILSLLLLLQGCSFLTREPEVITVTNTVRTTVPVVARPKPVQLNDVRVHVVTADNYDEFVEEFTAKNGTLVYVALSVKDYENLSLNFAELRRYIEQQQEIIVYYEESVRPEDTQNTLP